MVKIPMLINIIFNHADLWDDVGKHTHSIFVLGIEYGGKKRTRSQGKLVAWYYDSIEKKKDALIGKSFHKRGIRKQECWLLQLICCWSSAGGSEL